jgi:hypothetical protein
LKTTIARAQTSIPEHTRIKEAFMYSLASFICHPEKLFPKNLVLPRDTPSSTMTEKMTVREITVDDITITSGMVILDKKKPEKVTNIHSDNSFNINIGCLFPNCIPAKFSVTSFPGNNEAYRINM